MNKNHYCVIMAGGIGSRFWPLSRNDKPKQFIDALGIGKTFIQMTYGRFARFIPTENFLVVTGAAYKELVMEQLPMLKAEQVLIEPTRRNTAPCIAYATYKIYKKNPDAVVVVTPSDQLILDESTFEKVVLTDMQYAEGKDALVTIGIKPSYPATGYGYIQVDKQTDSIAKVVAFKEKPTLNCAKEFVSAGTYSWNSGMFIWSLLAIKSALEKHLPEIAKAFYSIMDDYDQPEEQVAVNATYEASQSISIDYGVMEKADNVYMSCADFGWSDVGSWGSLYQQLEKDGSNNALGGEDILISDSSDCLVKELNNKKTVIVDGMTNCLIVDTDDVLMICKLDDEDHIKKVITESVKQKSSKS